MTHGPTRTALALAAALLACAAVEPPPPGPSPFRSVKKLVLVRRVDDLRMPRGRDPLDALKESLEARGYQVVRVVDLGAKDAGDVRDVSRLEDRVSTRFWTRERWNGRAEKLDAEAAATVARLGADAVVGYHRLADQLPPMLPPAQAWGVVPAPMPTTQARRPTGALSLVAADGSAAWFPWGGAGADLDPAALLNPAEAIDAVMAALAGSTGDDG